MKIALCDDDKTDLDILMGYCNQYKGNFQTFSYQSAKALLSAYPSELFDIIFLDIEMAHPNGYEAAVELSHYPNPPIVIFTTQTINYAVRGYGVAFRYLPKPITYEMFCLSLRLAIKQKLPTRISIVTDSKIEVIAMSDINYIEVIRHQVTIHMLSKSDIVLNCSFSDVLKQLPPEQFIRTHKSYCVNLSSVVRMAQGMLTLVDGTQIPIGRNYKVQIKETLIAFLKGVD